MKLDELKRLTQEHYKKDGKFIIYFADPHLSYANTILNAMPALLKVVDAAKQFSTSQVLNEPYIGYSEQFANLLDALRELEEIK